LDYPQESVWTNGAPYDYLPDMIDIESATIHFSENQKVLMNACIGFIMFGIALNISIGDFSRIVRFPKAVLIGISSEWLVMPILTIYLIHLFHPNPGISLGMLLVAACPGGPMSNYMTHLSNGNAALSLTLTAIYTACCLFITPYTFLGFAWFVPEASHLITRIHLTAADMLLPLVSVLLIPVSLGMLTRQFLPFFTARILKWVRRLSLLIFISFIVFAVADNHEALVKYARVVFWIVLVQNAVGMAAGYYWAKWHRLPVPDRKAISFETGIHNSGLGLILIIHFFPRVGGMLISVAFWAVWDLISSLAVALYWKGRKPA
jgi:BASS family bile acid:Na+ symporter